MLKDKKKKSQIIYILIPAILIIVGLVIILNPQSKEIPKNLNEINDIKIEIKDSGSDSQASQNNIQSGGLPDLGAATVGQILGGNSAANPGAGNGIEEILEGKEIEVGK